MISNMIINIIITITINNNNDNTKTADNRRGLLDHGAQHLRGSNLFD